MEDDVHWLVLRGGYTDRRFPSSSTLCATDRDTSTYNSFGNGEVDYIFVLWDGANEIP